MSFFYHVNFLLEYDDTARNDQSIPPCVPPIESNIHTSLPAQSNQIRRSSLEHACTIIVISCSTIRLDHSSSIQVFFFFYLSACVPSEKKNNKNLVDWYGRSIAQHTKAYHLLLYKKEDTRLPDTRLSYWAHCTSAWTSLFISD